MSETPERRAQLSYGQIMMRQADQLATTTTATLVSLRTLSRDEDDSGQALVKASAVLVAAVTSAKIIGSRWAAVRFGRDSVAPQILTDDDHQRLQGALTTAFDDGASPQALTSLTRNEIVRASADAFAVESLDAISDPSFSVDDAREDLEEIPEPEEEDDDEDLTDDDGESDSERHKREALEDKERERESAEESARYDREMEEYLDRMDREDDADYERWIKKQDAEYDAEERREAEEEKEKRKPKKLPPAPSPDKQWKFVLWNDEDPCGWCRLAHGRRVKDPDRVSRHTNCGCTAVLTLVDVLPADRIKKKEKS